MLIVVMLCNVLVPNVSSASGIFLIRNSNDWLTAGFENNSNLPVYTNEGLTEFFMPIALKKEDVHLLQNKDVEHTIYNSNRNFTDRLINITFEILESDIYYVVLYKMRVLASNHTFNVDFIPKIKGEELNQYAWWNSSYSYSKSSYICNSVTDYQVKVTVGKTAGGDVNCGGNCQDDFDDIRFTKGDNTTELHYWMENYTNGVQASFWVNISDANVICMYYGNDAVSTTSNGANTFIYFDDWTNDNTGDWWSFRETGEEDTSNNVYNITGGIGYNNRLRYRHTMEDWVTAGVGASFRVGFCSNEWDVTKQYPVDWMGVLTSTDTSDGSSAVIQAWSVYSSIANVGYNDTDPFSGSAYYVRDFTVLSDNVTSRHYANDGTLMASAFQKKSDEIPPASDLDNIVMFTYIDGATSFFDHNSGDGELTVGGYRVDSKNVFSIDWMFLGEYAYPESSFCNWSSEFVSMVCPTFTFTGITPTHGSTTVSSLITNLSVDISTSTGATFNYTIECSNGNTTSANNVGNGTYALPVCCLEQETLYIWYVNVTHNVTCGWENATYNFTTKLSECLCTDELTAILNEIIEINENLEGDNVIAIDTTQFIIGVQLFLLCIFLWIGCTIPAIEGTKRSLHYMPFSGGLFIIFGGLDFISFSVVLTYSYDMGFVGGYLTFAGIVLLLYGVLKAFYYE